MATSETSEPTPRPERQLAGRRVEQHPALGEVHKVWRADGLVRRLGDRARAEREWRTLGTLFASGLPVPEPLGLAREPAGGWRLRMALIQGAETAEARLLTGEPPEQLLTALARLLADLHGAGLDQADLHAGNALVDPAGKPWAIDFQAARLGAPLAASVLERDLVVLAAAWREHLGPTPRQRFLIAWLRALPSELRRSLVAGAAHPKDERAALRDLAERVETAAVRRRRTQVAGYERTDSRWFRVSGACRAAGPGPEPARGARAVRLVAREVGAEREHELVKLLGGAEPTPGVELVLGHEALDAWGRAARLASHGLPGARPLLLDLGPEPCALLGAGLGTDLGAEAIEPLTLAPLALPPTPAERAPLEALLFDRGLELANDVPAAYRRLTAADGTQLLGLGPTARLRERPLAAAEQRAREAHFQARLARRAKRGELLSLWPKLHAPAVRPLTLAALSLASRAARLTPLEVRLRSNLATAFPDLAAAARADLARAARRHMARQASELGRFGRGAEREGAWLDALVEMDPSVAHLDAQLTAGRGVIVVTPHLGNWELLAAALVRRGARGAVIGRRRGRDPGGRWLEDLRARWGIETLPQDTSPRELLRRLARGEVIGVLPDLEVPRLAGLRLDFLGHEALVMSAPAALARAAGLPLLPARCVAVGDRYRLDFHAPLAPPEPMDGSDEVDRRDPRPLTEAWVRVFEAWIREAPEQWIWYHERWRTPPGPADGVPLAALRHAQRT